MELLVYGPDEPRLDMLPMQVEPVPRKLSIGTPFRSIFATAFI